MHRTLPLVALVLCAPAALAANVGLITDYGPYDGFAANADGVLNPGEYSTRPIPLSTATGGGGVLAGPGAQLLLNTRWPTTARPAGALAFGFQPGATLDHTVIIILDTRPGGRRAGSGPGMTAFNDTTDAARRALTTLQGVLPNHPGTQPGVSYNFAADFALTMNSSGIALFAFPDDAVATFTPVPLLAQGVGSGGFREALLDGESLGFNAFSQIFKFAVVYAGDNFLFNESIPAQPYSPGPNPGPQIGVTAPTAIPNFYEVQSFIPAPASAAAGLVLLGLAARRRR